MKATLSFGLKALAATVAVIAGSAHAASTYTFSGGGTYDAQNEQYAQTSYAGADAKLTISGVYATNVATGLTNAGVTDSTKTWNSNTASLPLYFGGNGLGMCSDPVSQGTNGGCPTSNPPNHAIDNVGNTEGILLSFTNSVVLQQIGLGFTGGDSDFSVFRYTGTSAPAALTGIKASASAMTTAGWELVGNYGDIAVDTSAPFTNINTGGKTSSWWLITAYNSGISGTTATTGTLSNNDDYFKIFAVAASTSCTTGVDQTTGQCKTTNVGKLPEPTTLALTGVALVGVAGLRRRKAKLAV